MTLAEFFSTPETMLPEELIYGSFRVADAPSVNHQRILLKLAIALQAHADDWDAGEIFLAPIDVVLDRERALVVQPDLLFVSNDRMHLVVDRIYGPPDLVVEILSPEPRIGRLDERVGWFAEYGVREIWLYDQPERQMHILRCGSGAVISRRVFSAADRLVSAALPHLDRTLGSILETF